MMGATQLIGEQPAMLGGIVQRPSSPQVAVVGEPVYLRKNNSSLLSFSLLLLYFSTSFLLLLIFSSSRSLYFFFHVTLLLPFKFFSLLFGYYPLKQPVVLVHPVSVQPSVNVKPGIDGSSHPATAMKRNPKANTRNAIVDYVSRIGL